MQVAITGATGFLGRYIAKGLLAGGHGCRCWHRPESDCGGFDDSRGRLEWLPGELGDEAAGQRLLKSCDALVHSALHHTGGRFRGGEGTLIEFAEKNVLGSLRLFEQARAAGVERVVFISTCGVHEIILEDRPLDESHPLWSTSHYGAHKAAIEKFVHSFGLGQGYDICSLRPTGIYGLARPAEDSKWFDLVAAVKRGEPVECRHGGKEVHAADVARAVELLLTADGIAGQSYNCYDNYVSQHDVATIAKRLSGSDSEIRGGQTRPKHQIETGKLRSLGMKFGGRELLEQTIQQMLGWVATSERSDGPVRSPSGPSPTSGRL